MPGTKSKPTTATVTDSLQQPPQDEKAEGSQSESVQRVAPYPIEALIIKAEGQPPVSAQIVKLTDIGFLMKVDGSQFYKVGDNYLVQFVLPVISHKIEGPIKVIKTYDTALGAGEAKLKVRTIEMHFRALTDAQRTQINSYLVKSGQRKL